MRHNHYSRALLVFRTIAALGSVSLSTSHSWEATLLRRRPGGRTPVVAGRIEIQAPDFESAKNAAEAAVAAREDGTGTWSLGVLRSLTMGAPGTHRYCVTFAVWESTDDRFVRTDVATFEIEACDALSARREARQAVQQTAGYQSAWRVREVVRVAAPEPTPGRMRRRTRPQPAALPH